MARSDLLVSLVKAGTKGDKRGFHSAAEAIIAEERAKRHDVLAERLSKAIQSNGNGHTTALKNLASLTHAIDPMPRGKEFISEVVPRRTFSDLVLKSDSRRTSMQCRGERTEAGSHGVSEIDPARRAECVGDGVQRNAGEQETVHRVHGQLRTRGDQLRDRGIGVAEHG